MTVTRRRRGAVGHALGWVAAAGLTAVAINRVWRSDAVPILIGVQGVTAWALLPAYPLAAFALWKRKWPLAAVALALSATQLVFTIGTIGWHGPQALPATDLPIRLASANLLYTNASIRQLGDDLAAEDADVVVVQEVTDEVLAELEKSALWTNYPYHSAAPEPLYHGAATFSKFPILDGHSIDVAGYPMLLTDLQTPAGVVRVINVHTVAPVAEVDAPAWAGQFPALSAIVAESPYPIVLAGDFNATLDHAPLEKLASGNLRDAFRVAGSGIGNTWPRWDLPVPPVMRLDHVLVSAKVDVASVTDKVSVGSDHRRLVVELGIPAAR